jgi:hypothetical protein
MRTLRRIAFAAALPAIALLSGGCLVAAVAAGAAVAYGAIQYDKNEARRDFQAPLDRTWKATLAALRDNGYPVSDAAEPGTTEGKIDIGDAKVVVEKVPSEPTETTRVRVRIGTFDSEDNRRKAGLILEKVVDYL